MFPLLSMGETAENVAEKYKVSRADQDAFALESHRRAAKAVATVFAEEIVAGRDPDKKGDGVVFAKDETYGRTRVLKSWPR